MRLAYHIGVHNNPVQFGWLLEQIYHPDDYFCLHIDAKASEADREEFLRIVGGRGNIHIIRSHSVIYGDWKLSEVELDGIRYFLSEYDDWDYFINLSGTCYPLKTRAEMIAELSADPRKNYINMRRLDEMPRYFARRKRWFTTRLGDRLIRLPVPTFQPAHLQLDHMGSAWHIITREFCAWVVSDPVAQDCLRFLKRVKLSNEFLMQMLISNSPFMDTLETDYKRFLIWKKHTPHPQTIRMENTEELLASTAFFARKFDWRTDEEVLAMLRERLKEREAAEAGGRPAAQGGGDVEAKSAYSC